jgi:probable phosphoglycerate mutase
MADPPSRPVAAHGAVAAEGDGGYARGVSAAQRVYLVRHGETEWSASGRHTSVTDVPLTDAGRRAAERLARVLAGLDLALVLTSPRSRARETAELAGLGSRAQVDDDLVEFDYGDYEGRTTPEIRESRPGWSLWDDDVPGGETLEAVGARADRVIARIRAVDGDVAVFAHGHLLRVLGARWAGLPPRAGGNLALSTGALCQLGYERERPAIWTWNDTCHLR